LSSINYMIIIAVGNINGESKTLGGVPPSIVM